MQTLGGTVGTTPDRLRALSVGGRYMSQLLRLIYLFFFCGYGD